jgi:cytochrome c-type protein NapB
MEAVMKKALLVTIVGTLMLLQAPLAYSEDKVASLRGDHELDKAAKAIEKKKQFKSGEGIERNWKLQPPSIPHDIAKDRITLKGNTCLKCHSKANAEKEKAPAVSESHLVTRDYKVLDKLSSRRYFCVQCHTPQADIKPLIENTFETNDIELSNLLMNKTK